MTTLNQPGISEGAIEARTIRKLKIRILPFIWLLYIVVFLDRINIGFAALTMNRELAITSQQFGLLTGIFSIGSFGQTERIHELWHFQPDGLQCLVTRLSQILSE